ncbi:MAG: helix-turn-helix transcriptional regulator [Acidimicrobiales bacterium]
MAIRWRNQRPQPPTPSQSLVPVPNLGIPDRTHRGGAALGLTLERARKRLGISSDTVCRELWLTDRELNQYESGLRIPPATVVERLAEFYGLELEQLQAGTPSRFNPAANDGESDRLWMGWTPVELETVGPENAARLRAVAQAVRFMRGLSERDPIVVRGDEVHVMAKVLDVYAADLAHDISDWFALDQSDAEELVAKLRYASDTIKRRPPALEGD